MAEAGVWLARLQSRDFDDSDALAFDTWLEASPENRWAYDRALATWNVFGDSASAVMSQLSAARRPVRRRPDRRWLIAGGGLAAAATVALAILPGLLADPVTDVYATAKGEHRTVELADGSRVDLNAETRLTVTLARDARRVVIGEGEAVFDVAADSDRPFVITAGDHIVRVVGTQFDVRNRGDDLAVTVTRGKVEVRPGTGVDGAYMLGPGDRLELAGDGEANISAVAAAEALSWRTGRVVYRNETLANVVDDLNRQFPTPIRIIDADLAATPVSGVLVVDTQAEVVKRLTLMLPVRAVPSDEGVLLRRR